MSKRLDIVKNRKTALETILVANGYNYDIGEATRELKHFRDLDAYPSVVIINAGETREGIDVGYNTVVANLVIRVRGIVKASADIEEVLDNFLEDVEKAMCNDITCGGYANYIAPSDIRIYEASADDIKIFDMDFIVSYQYIYGNP